MRHSTWQRPVTAAEASVAAGDDAIEDCSENCWASLTPSADHGFVDWACANDAGITSVDEPQPVADLHLQSGSRSGTWRGDRSIFAGSQPDSGCQMWVCVDLHYNWISPAMCALECFYPQCAPCSRFFACQKIFGECSSIDWSDGLKFLAAFGCFACLFSFEKDLLKCNASSYSFSAILALLRH